MKRNGKQNNVVNLNAQNITLLVLRSGSAKGRPVGSENNDIHKIHRPSLLLYLTICPYKRLSYAPAAVLLPGRFGDLLSLDRMSGVYDVWFPLQPNALVHFTPHFPTPFPRRARLRRRLRCRCRAAPLPQPVCRVATGRVFPADQSNIKTR